MKMKIGMRFAENKAFVSKNGKELQFKWMEKSKFKKSLKKLREKKNKRIQ